MKDPKPRRGPITWHRIVFFVSCIALLCLVALTRSQTHEASDAHILTTTTNGKTYWMPSDRFKIGSVLDARGWERVENENTARLVWTRSKSYASQTRPWQLVSLLDNLPCLTKKDGLALTMRTTVDIVPETYVMQDPRECRAFFSASDPEGRGLWVLKPTSESSGFGITFITPGRDYAGLKRQLGRCEGGRTDLGDVVLQRAIANPLLLQGHKMEIRSYWAVISVTPLRVVYHDGLVRLAAGLYNANDMSDRTAHVTNVAQAQSELGRQEYLALATELKWSLQRLNRYLFDTGLVPSLQYLDTTLRPELKRIIITALRAAGCVKHLPRIPGRFELLGMDTILDQNLHVWLTEMQHGPGLSIETPLKRELVHDMLDELSAMVVELDDRRRAGESHIPTLHSMKNWEWLINEHDQ